MITKKQRSVFINLGKELHTTFQKMQQLKKTLEKMWIFLTFLFLLFLCLKSQFLPSKKVNTVLEFQNNLWGLRTAGYVAWPNRFLGSLKVYKFGLCRDAWRVARLTADRLASSWKFGGGMPLFLLIFIFCTNINSIIEYLKNFKSRPSFLFWLIF